MGWWVGEWVSMFCMWVSGLCEELGVYTWCGGLQMEGGAGDRMVVMVVDRALVSLQGRRGHIRELGVGERCKRGE